MKTIIYNEGQLIKERLAKISDYIYNNPELGNKEYKAVEALTTFLKEHNFQVECPIADMDTAFKATFDNLMVPEDNCRLVLVTDEVNELLLLDQIFKEQYNNDSITV